MNTYAHKDLLEAGLTDWRDLAQGLHARFATGDFAAGLRFVDAVGAAAEEAGHHPDVTLTYPQVDIALVSHDVGAITGRDVELAQRISAIAADQNIEARPADLVQVELALDTADIPGIGPFWAALLHGDTDSLQGGDVVGNARVPLLWFQDTDAHETPRQRFHLDVWVPAELAQERIEAALAAGGTMVDEEAAPAFVVLADAEGNRACVCTTER
ncbi:4a-hydroxytetrahydrobiopterin dehydratase [Ornithinimicrobium faecis]|uniref:Putative pterin-4-alpha-carbinolamine dehydratase n=1 Tax=Ornithinimicrobium faecis TaxID=2934158 RepID=A0ABY4YYX3_9MICO|nr:4a-hydroxytetrahydrobiopterin dehydratase [Ornithinimicrobium sp. HY1793]USQ81952.1 4a-hydroxytetrahydrobiopterin dehydratase [Ornithinimicrobium sp. HY1793]